MELALKELRKKLHMSQADFAAAVGVSDRTVGSWERGESFPNAEQIWNCAVTLECTPNDIFRWGEQASDDDSLTPDECSVIEGYRQCSPAWQQSLASMVRLAAESVPDSARGR